MAEVQEQRALVAPAIGSAWEGQGGVYAGIVRGDDGQPDYHLILAQAKPAARLAWKKVLAWAADVEVDGHKDFQAPSRRESAILFGNLGDQIEADWYWTREQKGASSAWYCYFTLGSQSWGYQYGKGRAVAVRRLPLQSFDPS